MTIRRSAALFLFVASVLAAWAAPPKAKPAGPAAGTPVPTDALAELRATFDRGDCDGVLTRAKTLRAEHAPNIDVLVLEANCRLQQARRTEQVFDALRYDQFRIAQGGGVARPREGANFFRTVTTFDAGARREALGLFRQALDLDPTRADLIVGNVAALANGGDMDQALDLLKSRKDKVTPEAQDDLGRVVQDLLTAGERERASGLATGMSAAFPKSTAARKALAACALDRRDVAEAINQLLPVANPALPDQELARTLVPLLLFSRRWSDAVAVVAPVVGDSQEFLFWMALARMRVAPASAAPLFSALAEQLAKSPKPSTQLVKICDHYVRVVSDPRRPTVVMRLRAAERFRQAGFPLASVAELDDALDQAPKSIEAWTKLGDLYRHAGMYSLALDAFDHALAIAKDAPAGESPYSPAELQADRGRVLFGLDRSAEAVDAFRMARAGGHPAPFEEGISVLSTGDKVAAFKLLEEAAMGEGEDAAAAKAKVDELQKEKP